MQKEKWAEIVFWLHLPIVIVLIGLIFIPTSLWPGRVVFHFWYTVGIIGIQLIFSILVLKRVDIICPLTTLMQRLRGYPIKSEKNYKHSYFAELSQKLHLRISYKTVKIMVLLLLILVTTQFFFFRN